MIKTEKIYYDDRRFPDRLRHIFNPPECLYFRGDISILDTPSVASVGSRNASEYGRRVALEIGKTSALFGVTLISGMAKGIDGYSHTGALDFGGKTIAVLGTGCDICYPKENAALYSAISERGLIISEYPDGTGPAKYTFPMRNRIISALSKAVIVCEAEISSGSMITAELAIEQGKEVFAVPGNIFSPLSLGTNKLISDGARPVFTVPEIFRELGFERIKEEIIIDGKERYIYETVRAHGELSLKDLSRMCRLSETIVKNAVSHLEMKGFLSYYMGKVLIAK
ncbi:MAG: DNA-processing protein DprA [Clostridia bacterium]|nr:DNA-processing protein DprA [Clostridia bacterium]